MWGGEDWEGAVLFVARCCGGDRGGEGRRGREGRGIREKG